jgi:hypothetical protein
LSGAQKRLSKSLFVIVIGSNDIFDYSGSSDLQKKSTPQQYVDSMVLTIKGLLKVFGLIPLFTGLIYRSLYSNAKLDKVLPVKIWSIKHNPFCLITLSFLGVACFRSFNY